MLTHSANHPVCRATGVAVLVAITMAPLLSCGDGAISPTTTPNHPPVAVGTIQNLTVFVGDSETVDVSSHFTDPDGDKLTYVVNSSDPAVVTATSSGSVVNITGVAQGTVAITVTGTDPEGLTATQVFDVLVPNRAPVLLDSIPSLGVTVGDTTTVDLSAYFNDPDGDELTYSASTSDPAIATVSVSDSQMLILPTTKGAVTITVMAQDPKGLSVTQRFSVVAEPPLPTVSFVLDSVHAREGANVRLAVVVVPPATYPIAVPFELRKDNDPATADADTLDYAGGQHRILELSVGDQSATIELTIRDDNHIEPTRELFSVSLSDPGPDATYRLGQTTSMQVHINEGVCDRTEQIRDEILRQTGDSDCADPDARSLVGILEMHLTPPTDRRSTVLPDRRAAPLSAIPPKNRWCIQYDMEYQPVACEPPTHNPETNSLDCATADLSESSLAYCREWAGSR